MSKSARGLMANNAMGGKKRGYLCVSGNCFSVRGRSVTFVRTFATVPGNCVLISHWRREGTWAFPRLGIGCFAFSWLGVAEAAMCGLWTEIGSFMSHCMRVHPQEVLASAMLLKCGFWTVSDLSTFCEPNASSQCRGRLAKS